MRRPVFYPPRTIPPLPAASDKPAESGIARATDDPAGGSMILFAVSTLSYTDTRTIGWPFLITIPAISAVSAIAYRLPIHLEQESADLGSFALREHFLPHLWCRLFCFAQFDYSRCHSVLLTGV